MPASRKYPGRDGAFALDGRPIPLVQRCERGHDYFAGIEDGRTGDNACRRSLAQRSGFEQGKRIEQIRHELGVDGFGLFGALPTICR